MKQVYFCNIDSPNIRNIIIEIINNKKDSDGNISIVDITDDIEHRNITLSLEAEVFIHDHLQDCIFYTVLQQSSIIGLIAVK